MEKLLATFSKKFLQKTVYVRLYLILHLIYDDQKALIIMPLAIVIYLIVGYLTNILVNILNKKYDDLYWYILFGWPLFYMNVIFPKLIEYWDKEIF